MGWSEFTAYMNLQDSDAPLFKYLTQTMFKSKESTIYPHFMLTHLKPFRIFATIPMN